MNLKCTHPELLRQNHFQKVTFAVHFFNQIFVFRGS